MRDRIVHYRYFNFIEFGGVESALKAAQAWRDNMAARHPPDLRMVRASKLLSTNVTGVAGVTVQYGRDGLPKLWLAKTNLGSGTILRKAFSVSRYGAEARALAIEERAQQLAQMTGITSVHPSEPLARDAGKLPKAIPIAVKQNKAEMLRTTNQSGSAGVVRRKGRQGHPGYWTAQTAIGSRWISKSFSVKAHGEEGARAMAIEERAKQVTQHQTALRTEGTEESDCKGSG